MRIQNKETLERFMAEWKLHNPLTADQLAFVGKTATVGEVGFYHGGDVLYQLKGVPGVWHEQCLEGA